MKSTFLPLFKVKRCSKCRKDLPLSKFYCDRTSANGHTYYCKDCALEGMKKPIRKKRRKEYIHGYTKSIKGKALILFNRCKRRADKYNDNFDLTVSWIEEKLKEGHCELTGLKFDLIPGGKNSFYQPYAPSIDRRDSKRGYNQQNCRVILCGLNAAFNEWGEETFLKIAQAYFKKRDDNNTHRNKELIEYLEKQGHKMSFYDGKIETCAAFVPDSLT